MATAISPNGEHHKIPEAGVEALRALGWDVIEGIEDDSVAEVGSTDNPLPSVARKSAKQV